MIDLDKIETAYSEFSTEKLLDIAKNMESINVDVQPILKKELEKRGKLTNTTEEKKSFNKIKKAKESYDALSYDLDKELKDRIQAGEVTVEDIKEELARKGLDFYKVMGQKAKKDEFLNSYVEKRIAEKTSISEVKKELIEVFNIDESQSKEIIKKYKKKGNKLVYIGIALVILSIAMMLVSNIRSGGISIIYFAKFCFGVYLITKGQKQAD